MPNRKEMAEPLLPEHSFDNLVGIDYFDDACSIPDSVLIEAYKAAMATQEATLSSVVNRFSTPVTNADVYNFVKEVVPKNTTRQMVWAAKLWNAWRASAATRLFRNDVPEQLIMKLTGHRSSDGVWIYKTVKREQFKEMSNILQGNDVNKQQLGERSSPDGCQDGARTEADCEHQGNENIPYVTLNNCSGITFNFYH